MKPECITCLDETLKDPAHRIKEVDCANCTGGVVTVTTTERKEAVEICQT